MEAFATLSFVGNVIQLVEVSSKLVKTAIRLRNSASGVPNDINDAIVIRDRLVSVLQGVGTSGSIHSEHDRQLAGLAEGCRSVCGELLDQVNRIKGKGDSSKTGVLGVAWRTLTDGGKLNSIEQRLDRYRSQILAHIVVMLDQKQSATHSLIASSIEQQGTHAQSLRMQIDKIKEDVIAAIKSELHHTQSSKRGIRTEPVQDVELNVDRFERTIPKNLSHAEGQYPSEHSEAQLDILAAVRDSLATIAQASKAITIHDWLFYPELLSRESAIRDAHEKTYTWLLHDEYIDEGFEEDFNEDAEEESDEGSEEDFNRDITEGINGPDMHLERSRQRDAMCNWLKNGRGIFYISGKAGSGKSTLMKYLAGAPQTLKHLTNWANSSGKELVFAPFFFWRPGTPLQRSTPGLYRGILWKLLDAHPALIPDVFPMFRADLNRGKSFPFEPTLPELEAAFDILIKNPRVLSKHRVCLFIDGLDEFEGDYWKLSQRLVKWCDSDDIKICVSSRPKNEFSKAFSTAPGVTQFSLHHLTRPDMLRFVLDTFEKDSRYTDACNDNDGCASLSSLIVDRADGVFLWVRLVVSELLVAMGNSDSLVQLEQRLAEIPTDLRPLFNQMLRRVNRMDRMKLSRTFMLLQFCFERGVNRDRDFIGTTVYAQAVLDDIADNPDLVAQLVDGSVGPFLSNAGCISKCNQMCRRLIGRCQGLLDIVETGRGFPHCHRVNFFHRTVSDFLKEPEIESDIQKGAGVFNPRQALAHTKLARVKFVNPDLPKEDSSSSGLERDAAYRFHCTLLDVLALSREECSLFDEVSALKRMVGNIQRMPWMVYISLGQKGDYGAQISFGINITEDLDSAVLYNTLRSPSTRRLAEEIIRRSPPILDRSTLNPLVSVWLYAIPVMDESNISIIRLLLEGGESPNTKLPNLLNYMFNRLPTVDDPIIQFATTSLPMTPWTLFLLTLSLNWTLCKPRKEIFLGCIELLLYYGADPSVYFVGYEIQKNATEDPARRGPYYTDLTTMMALWGLQPADQAQRVPSGPATLSTYFRRLRRRGRAQPQHARPLQLDVSNKTQFLVTHVLPWHILTQASVTELEAVHRLCELVLAGHKIKFFTY
ncbi:hypothetical protein GGR51DRAFT_555973 [Nemania sp. FL0031]|nr:hypothetical protein GGR51DRAFT_555973 [Nemania sp. FL0031]